MSHRADPRFLSDLQRYGALKIESCFNCGNCTAVCPLSSGEETFPRRMIRYAQLGMKEKLLRSKELWMCYACGECTATCPRDADPGEFMAATRRYAIANYDRSGLAQRLYTSPFFNIVFFLLLTIGLGVFLYGFHGPMPGDSLRLFEFIPSAVIHDVGIIAGLLVVLVAVLGAMRMVGSVSHDNLPTAGSQLDRLRAIWETAGEVISQRRYRQDFETYCIVQPWFAQKWFIHASMLWGFLGLFLATALDYLLELIGMKPIGTWVPIWYPIRLLGTLSGIALVYGSSFSIVKRWRKADESTANSTPSDWVFLVLLWLGGITGFALEAALYLPEPHAWSYWMLLAHLVVVGELMLLLPFTKFMHVIYRTVALYFHALRSVPVAEHAGTESADFNPIT